MPTTAVEAGIRLLDGVGCREVFQAHLGQSITVANDELANLDEYNPGAIAGYLGCQLASDDVVEEPKAVESAAVVRPDCALGSQDRIDKPVFILPFVPVARAIFQQEFAANECAPLLCLNVEYPVYLDSSSSLSPVTWF